MDDVSVHVAYADILPKLAESTDHEIFGREGSGAGDQEERKVGELLS